MKPLPIIGLFSLLLTACSLTDQFNSINDGSDGIQSEEVGGTTTDIHDSVLTAINTGNTESVTTKELTDAAVTLIQTIEEDALRVLNETFLGTDGVTWDPSHDSALIDATLGENLVALRANDSGSNTTDYQPLAVAGQRSDSRYLVLGGNPMRNAYRESSDDWQSMNLWLSNSLSWLTRKPLSDINHIVVAQLDQSYYFPDQAALTEWFDQHAANVSFNEHGACDGSALAGCLADAGSVDLLILSQMGDEDDANAVSAAVAQALASGIPVLYLHHNGDLRPVGEALFSLLRVRYLKDNYWDKQKITGLSQTEAENRLTAGIEQLSFFISALESDLWTFDLSACDDGCDNQPQFSDEFENLASTLRDRLRGYDATGLYLFEETGYHLEKALILLADKYRSDWSFPLDKTASSRSDFVRTLFADYAQYQLRTSVPVPSHLGNFSRTVFPGVSTTDQTITQVSRQPFRAAGVYALPGQPIRVTRTDSSPVSVSVFVNTIRDGATHLWDENGYTRPKYLRSQALSIDSGESFVFTSTFGGPVQIAFNTNGESVTLKFDNVALHPYWNGPEDDTQFSQALEAGQFDWAELSTPAFEVHSKLDKMRESAADPNWPTGAELAEATMRYTFNYPHILAGYQGEGIDRVEDIIGFAETKNWTVSELTQVKHMNADQATCGYGCSGNPYDAYWAFNPVGHGDIHELGHGLERTRFRFETENGHRWETHATTNPYSYYSKSRFTSETAQPHSCQSLPFETLYGHLQDAQQSADAYAHMAGLNLTSWNTGVATYIQLMMAVQNQGYLNNGWHLWARLHIYEREFNRVSNSDDAWTSARDSLGMGALSRGEARALNNNDWMAIALSTAAQADVRAFLDLYGIAVSVTANAQLDSLGLPELNAGFYGVDGANYCNSLSATTLPLDGTSEWP